MNSTKKCLTKILSLRCCCRRYSKKPIEAKKKAAKNDEKSRIRNIGILAHIDAGKTTTTERMLFYSGSIQQMGEVHHGNTVTDFLEQERQRGITIASASVTFSWENHTINLIDTPGHIDFTVEVEQALNVMDGAVIILDGSAGVEAQTLTVWRQADRHEIPRIIYINKMDKPTAELSSSINSVHKQLDITPVMLQLPIIDQTKSLKGIIDLLTLKKHVWSASTLGENYSADVLTDKDEDLWENALKERVKLTETLADLDDTVAEIIVTDEKKLNTISSNILEESIRKITLEKKGVPILCGSSYKNIGVQLLMNAIINYLPSPLCAKSKDIMETFGNNLCARAFKVRHDPHKGPIIFLRLYSGELTKNQKVYNVKKGKNELCRKVFIPYGEDYEEVPNIGAGKIAAVSGLQETSCGDLITNSNSAFSSAQKALASKNVSLTLESGALIPDPVFFCSIETSTQREQSILDKVLSELEREDPSLRVKINDDTGQTILAGMGELHLEVIKENIKKNYNLDVDTGPLQIAYKEALIEEAKDTFHIKHQIGAVTHQVSITLSVLKTKSDESEKLLLDRSPDCVDNISVIFPKHLLAVKSGVESALNYGPKLFCPVVNVSVMLHWLEVGKRTTESIIVSATAQSVRKLLKQGGTKLLEPVMMVEIICSSAVIQDILNDLSGRKAEICSTDARGSDLVVKALIPLSRLLGYSTELRILSSGRAGFSMEFHSYKDMDSEEEAKAIKSVTGFSC